jgi:3-oxoacyl-[acyl-carrier-protein] synthase-3
LIKSTFNNIRISGIACTVPTKKEVLLDKYGYIFGEETVNKFSKMTGVISRHITFQKQTASDLSCEAANYLFNQKDIKPETIGAVVFVTQTPDYRILSSACVLHKRLGLSKDCMAFDVNLGCSGYVYGMQILSSLMVNSNISRGLLLAADTSTKLYAPEDRSSCMLFGDAGSATLLEKVENDSCMEMGFRTDGNGFKAIIIPAGAYRNINSTHERTMWGDGNMRSDYDLYMNGADVFNFTISEVPRLLNEFMLENNTTPEYYDSFLMHQANVYILKQIAKRCKIPLEKVPISMDKYGNTSVTSIPLTLADKYGSEGNHHIKVLMCGFGVGLSLGVVSTELDTKDVYPIFESDDFYSEGAVSRD